MKHTLSAVAALALLAGCAGMTAGDMNPMSWFGGGSEPSPTAEPAAAVDPRELIPQVIAAEARPMSDGYVLLAEGQAPAEGFWDPVLVPTNDEMPLDGILTYEFRAAGPTEAVVEGEQYPETLQAARTITAEKLDGVAGIRIIALNNILDLGRTQQ